MRCGVTVGERMMTHGNRWERGGSSEHGEVHSPLQQSQELLSEGLENNDLGSHNRKTLMWSHDSRDG